MKNTIEGRAPKRSVKQAAIQASVFALCINASFAQTAMPTMDEIPTFDDAAMGATSDAFAVSGDGSVVVGVASDSSGQPLAFSYASGAFTNVASLSTTAPSQATGVNADGSVISGNVFNGVLNTSFVWTQATGMVMIPTGVGIDSQTGGVSGDGRFVVGTIFDGAPSAYVWNRAANTYVTLPELTLGGGAFGNDISDDGSVVVGIAGTSGAPHAFRAIVGGAITDLGTIGGAVGRSEAEAVSGDGQVVVGSSVATGVTGRRAFRWTSAGGMVQLNSTDEADTISSAATAASSDGSFVAGVASYLTTGGTRALRWDSAGVAIDLGDLTSDNSGASVANGISDDGSIVVGQSTNDAGGTRGFIWRDAVAPGGTMLDHVNTLVQVSENAAQQAAGATQLDKLVQFTLGQSIEMPVDNQPGYRGKARTGRPYSLKITAGASDNPDGNNMSIAGLTGAVAINQALSVGGHIGFGGDSDDLAGFGIDGNFRSFGIYVQGGQPQSEGLNWKVAAAQTAANVDITRSTALANTERGTGSADMSAGATSVELGYGNRRGASLVTPFLRLTRSVVKRDGYSETSAVAFPVTYDDYEISSTIVTLGSDFRMPVSDAGAIKLTAGIEWDLSRSTSPVTGTSAIPGMTTFAIASPTLEHEQRLFAEAHYTHSLKGGRSYDLGIGIHQTAYADKPSLMASVGYQMDF